MEFSEVIETQKMEFGAVVPITDPLTETENQTDESVQGIGVTPSEVYKAIGDVLENVWLALTDNMRADLMTGLRNGSKFCGGLLRLCLRVTKGTLR